MLRILFSQKMDESSLHFQTYKNLRNVSLVFFLLLGLIHFLSGMLLNNKFLVNINYLINRSFDIPFVMSGIVH